MNFLMSRTQVKGSRIAQTFTRIHNTCSRTQAMNEEQMARVERMEKSQAEMNSKLTTLIEMVSNMSREKRKIEEEEGSTHNREEYVKVQNGLILGAKRNEEFAPDLDGPKEMEKLMGARNVNCLDERLRAIEGIDLYGATDADGTCVVLGAVIPPKFKTLEFEKFDGTKCPIAHLTMFCRKIVAHTKDEKFLMHIFQDSLTGSAARWYVKLDRDRISTWNELARAFITQFKHIIDMAPDKLSLQNIEKKHIETSKEYVQGGRDMTSQVQSSLIEKETTILCKNYADMTLSREIIEKVVRNGKINGETTRAKKIQASKLEDDDVQLVGHRRNSYPYRLHKSHAPRRTPQEKPLFDPIPVTYTELLPKLIQNHLVAPIYSEPRKPPYPKGHDVNATCDYHLGSNGHSTENCGALKRKVKSLIQGGVLKFDDA